MVNIKIAKVVLFDGSGSVGEDISTIIQPEDAQTDSNMPLATSLGDSKKRENLLAQLHLTQAQIKGWSKEGWSLFLKEWFKAYPQSRFSMNYLGKFATRYDGE